MSATIALPAASLRGNSLLVSLAAAVTEGVRRHRERRQIARLLTVSPQALDDMGLSTSDIRQSLKGPGSASETLEDRRARRSCTWSPRTTPATTAAI